jgi:hypothetical protein
MKMKKKSVANQGTAGKAYQQPARKDGVPRAASPAKGSTAFAKQPGGTKGSKNK